MSRNPDIAYVSEGKLRRADGSVICSVGPRTGWFDWLEDNNSFRFEGRSEAWFTAVKERRKGATGHLHFYWYAHRRIGGKLKRRFLGKSEKVTLRKMERAAGELAQLEISQQTAETEPQGQPEQLSFS